MRTKKIHLFREKDVGIYSATVCGQIHNWENRFNVVSAKEFITDTPEELQCKACKKTNYYKTQLEKMEKERVASDDELAKTQLEIDTEKYNLKPEHIEILSKIDYEVVDAYNSCEACVFDRSKYECPELENGKLSCCDFDSDIIFKQIYTTQESLNKSIEKESDKEPVEEPFFSLGTTTDFVSDTLHIDTNKINRIFDENNKMIWVKPPEYKPEDVSFKSKKPSSYHKSYYSMLEDKSVILDTYDLLDTIELPNDETKHSFKKLTNLGKRSGGKTLLEDLKEAYISLGMGIDRIKRIEGEK